MQLQGLAYAVGVYREMQAAFDAVADRVREEQIECGFKIRGRLVLTKAKRQYDDLARELELRKTHLGSDFTMLPRAALRDEIAGDLYCGGALIPDLGSIHPGLYHRGLLDRARAAGATLIAPTPLDPIAPAHPPRLHLTTPLPTPRPPHAP